MMKSQYSLLRLGHGDVVCVLRMRLLHATQALACSLAILWESWTRVAEELCSSTYRQLPDTTDKIR